MLGEKKFSMEKMLNESVFNVTGKKSFNVIKKTALCVEHSATALFGPFSNFKMENILKMKWMHHNTCPMTVRMMDGL